MYALFLVHLIISIIYFFYWFKKNKQEGVFRLAIVLFLPLLGYMLFLNLGLLNRFIKNKDRSQILFFNDYDNRPKNNEFKYFDVNRELNLIPMEEALLINNYHIKRKMILGIIKEEMGKYPGILIKALSNEDSETSHYAATAIVELRRKRALLLQTWSDNYRVNGSNQDILISYANSLSESLHSGILDESNYKNVKSTYRIILKQLLDNYVLEQKYYIDKITYDIEDGDYLSALFYSEKFINEHPKNEEPYLLYLKLYYLIGETSNFYAMLKKLDETSIVLTRAAWSTVSFWKMANEHN